MNDSARLLPRSSGWKCVLQRSPGASGRRFCLYELLGQPLAASPTNEPGSSYVVVARVRNT
jgi:hypothetical protein